MKTIDYILIGIIAAIITAAGIYVIIEWKNAAAQAVDTYQLQQLKVQYKSLVHQSDSINDELELHNRALIYANRELTAQRDSLVAIANRKVNHIKNVYQDKINHLSVLPDDSLHSVFAKQLSTSGSN